MGNLQQFLLSSNHSVIDRMKYFGDLYRKVCTGKEFAMASAAGLSETILYDTLVNYLISMARTVEIAMNRALEAIVSVDDAQHAVHSGDQTRGTDRGPRHKYCRRHYLLGPRTRCAARPRLGNFASAD